MSATMLSITAPTYTDPSGYELSRVARPTVTEGTDVVIRVHAASINPVDVKKADGVFKAAVKEQCVFHLSSIRAKRAQGPVLMAPCKISIPDWLRCCGCCYRGRRGSKKLYSWG